MRRSAAARTQVIDGHPREHRERNLIRPVHNHRPLRGDIFLCQQGGEFRLFQIADRELLAVVLPEHKARERTLLGERNEHGGERRALIEVRKIPLQIRIGDLGAQTCHFLRIDRQPLACPP